MGAESVADILRDMNPHSESYKKKLEGLKPEGYEELLAIFIAAGKPLKRIKKYKA